MEAKTNRMRNCAECEFSRMYDYGRKMYYCNHKDRVDDMGKLGENHLPVVCPEWCPFKEQ